MFEKNVTPIIKNLFSKCDHAVVFVCKDNEAVTASYGSTNNILRGLAESIIRFTETHKKGSCNLDTALRDTHILLSIEINKIMDEKLLMSSEKQLH